MIQKIAFLEFVLKLILAIFFFQIVKDAIGFYLLYIS